MADNYEVKTSGAPRWAPALYGKFAVWLKKQPHNGSETEVDVLADSFEAFLLALAKGSTDIGDLDHVEVPRGELREARRAFQDWLKSEQVKPPKAPRFDLEVWLGDHKSIEKKPTNPDPVLAAARFAGDAAALEPLELDALLAELIPLLGRRADDPVLIEFMEKRVGKKCPPTVGDSKWITWSKHKVDLLFDPDPENEKYPQKPKGRSFVPYLTTLNFTSPKTRYPFGLTAGLTEAQLVAKFGQPSLGGTLKLKRWHVPLIPARDVVLSHYEPGKGNIYIRIKNDNEKLARRP
jgi:hypothetical protein